MQMYFFVCQGQRNKGMKHKRVFLIWLQIIAALLVGVNAGLEIYNHFPKLPESDYKVYPPAKLEI
jgi:hypothetical protein